MKSKVATTLAGGIVGMFAAQGQTPFPGPLTTDTWDTLDGELPPISANITVSLLPGTHTIALEATFQAQVEVESQAINPGLELYTVAYNSVIVSLVPNPNTPGLLNPQPLVLNLGPVSGSMLIAQGATEIIDVGPVTKSTTAQWLGSMLAGPQGFTVTWVSFSSPTIGGGKLGNILGSGEQLWGSVQAVPEPHEYAMIAGLGLIGFAVLRGRRR